MTREQLEHAIRAACDVANDTELLVFGSQSILGEHPDAPNDLKASVEVDLQPRNKPDAIDRVDGALGELSQFHATHGFYVHGVSIEAATLPHGWDERMIPVRGPMTDGHTGHCLETHDLAASKLVAYRDKDRDFVRTLLVEGLCDARVFLERIAALPIPDDQRAVLVRWIETTVSEL